MPAGAGHHRGLEQSRLPGRARRRASSRPASSSPPSRAIRPSSISTWSALGYLIIGLFVYFRRGSAQKARHFYVFCLVSFIFSAFHYTGKLNGFDQVILFGNVAAGLLAPTLFLHFCLTFPEPRPWLDEQAARRAAVPARRPLLMLVYVGFSSGMLRVNMPLVEVREMLDRVWMLFLTAMYLTGAAALSLEHKRTEDPIVRQQLKWLRNGAFLRHPAVRRFSTFCRTCLGIVPNAYMKMSVLSLPLIPLTLAYAIVRYRLMDVDILFRRGYAYTLATLCVLAGFYGIVFSLASLVQKNFKDLRTERPGGGHADGGVPVPAGAQLDSGTARPLLLSRPLRLPAHAGRVRARAELGNRSRRHALGGGRAAAADALHPAPGFLPVRRKLRGERAPRFYLQDGRRPEGPARTADHVGRSPGPDASSTRPCATPDGGSAPPYLFFDRTRYLVDAVSRAMPASERQTIADLDLTYYLPCTVRGRTIAFLGVSRTEDGDFLSSDDVELLLTLSGYVGIAIENARLYRSLQRKVEENERLKEFSENIVESINVGILAVDLDDRVESWNTQIEQLTGIRRDKAVGRTLAELLPADLVEQFDARARRERHSSHLQVHSAARGHAGGRATASNGTTATGMATAHAGRKESTLNIAIAPLISRNMEQIGRLIIFDDVTDRAELERRLVQADKLSSIGLLAAGVAHEVNTPLAVISTYAQMLAKQVADDEQKSKLLEKIAKQTFRASEIVNSLLNFSRTSTTEFGEVSVNRVIQETLSLLEHQMKKAGLEVHTRSRRRARPPITGNPGKLQQVFLNLFLNARDAMSAGRRARSEDLARGRRRRPDRRDRQRARHRPGAHPPHLRSLLHHQGRAQGHGPRPFGHIRYHSGAWRRHQGLQPAWRRHPLPPGVSSVTAKVTEACYCLKMPEARS